MAVILAECHRTPFYSELMYNFKNHIGCKEIINITKSYGIWLC